MGTTGVITKECNMSIYSKIRVILPQKIYIFFFGGGDLTTKHCFRTHFISERNMVFGGTFVMIRGQGSSFISTIKNIISKSFEKWLQAHISTRDLCSNIRPRKILYAKHLCTINPLKMPEQPKARVILVYLKYN